MSLAFTTIPRARMPSWLGRKLSLSDAGAHRRDSQVRLRADGHY